MLQTGEAVYRAYSNAIANRDDHRPFAVTCDTGAGKTLSSLSLALSLAKRGQPSAIVVKEIAEIERLYRILTDFVSTDTRVAAWTSCHKVDADPQELERRLAEISDFDSFSGGFSYNDCEVAVILLTTHSYWKLRLEHDETGGFATEMIPNPFTNQDPVRRFTIVDEDPDFERCYTAQPENILELHSLLVDAPLEDDDPFQVGLAKVVRAVADRMAAIKEEQNSPLAGPALVSEDNRLKLMQLNAKTLRARLETNKQDTGRLKRLEDSIEFLKAAARGWTFYSKMSPACFYAYSFAFEPPPQTVVLDGTAFLAMYRALGDHVITVDAPRVDYSELSLSYVRPPEQWANKLNNNGLLRTKSEARPYIQWLHEKFIPEHTSPGENILVYTKKRVLEMGLHREFDEDVKGHFSHTEFQGRRIHWCNFAAGRGTNRFRECTVYIRLGDYYPPKAPLVSKAASLEGQDLSEDDYRRLGSGRTTHPLYETALKCHLMTYQKQEAARSAIRKIDKEGRASKTRLYMIDGDLEYLREFREAMFPGATDYQVISYESESVEPSIKDRLLDWVRTTNEQGPIRLTQVAKELNADRSKVTTLVTQSLKETIEREGWHLGKAKDFGLSGRGDSWCLKRTPNWDF